MTNDAGASGAPRFDVVLRGYDRRQVDEHVARMQRIIGRMRADLELARSQPLPIIPAPSMGVNTASPAPRPRPTPRPRPRGAGEAPDIVGSFTDRMQSILQAAEDEAAEIRKKAHNTARTETQAARAEVAELSRQRDVMIGELNRLRGQLESMLSAPTARLAPVIREPASAARPEAASATGPQPAVPPATGPQPAAPAKAAPAKPPQPKPTPPKPATASPAKEQSATPEPAPTVVVEKDAGATKNGTGKTDAPAAKPNGSATGKPEEALETRAVAEVPAKPGDLFKSGAGDQPKRPADVEATVVVSAVRAVAPDATVAAPVVRAEQAKDERKGNGERGGEAANRKRSPSPSRSG